MSHPFDPDAADGDGIFGLRDTPETARTVLIPVPWDVTTSYRPGAAKGPAAILDASGQIDLEDRETGRPYEAGIAMLPIPDRLQALNTKARTLAEPVIEQLGARGKSALAEATARVNEHCATMNEWVETTAETWLDRNKRVGVVGGDHSVPFGLIRALAERRPGLGILHIDAHADLRDAYEGFTWSHASIFHNVMEHIPGVTKLVQVGVRDYSRAEREYIESAQDRIHTWFDADLKARQYEGEPWGVVAGAIVNDLPETVYVSFDIDGLDPALCPNTGTPVPGGLQFPEATALLSALVRSGRTIAGFDLCEVAPDHQRRTDWDANVGMRMLYKLIGFTLLSER